MMIAWYSQNVDGSDPGVVPYPIGLDLHTLRDRKTAPRLVTMLKKIGTTSPRVAARPLRVFSDLNLMLSDARREANAAVEGCIHVDFASRRLPQIEIWHRYASYPFVMSAHGNGRDCHRTWEVLFLGCIAIVKTSSLDPLYDGLPVVIVDDWRQVRDVALLKRWLDTFAPLTDPGYIQRRLEPKAWLRPLREKLALSG
jgi:hypothetical protein